MKIKARLFTVAVLLLISIAITYQLSFLVDWTSFVNAFIVILPTLFFIFVALIVVFMAMYFFNKACKSGTEKKHIRFF